MDRGFASWEQTPLPIPMSQAPPGLVAEVPSATDAAYRALFEWASDALFVHDLETGAVVDANRAACELYGGTLADLKALGVGGISEGTPPYDASHAAAYVQRAAGGEPQRFEWVVRRATGERVWVEVRLRNAEIDGADRVLASVRPIDERKRTEAALHEARAELERRVERRTADLARAEQRFRAIVEASPVPLLLSHATDGVVLYANDRLESLVGVEPGGLVGQRTPDFYYDAADRPLVLQKVRDEGYARDVEVRIRRADGAPRWVSLSVQRLTFNGEPALATALVDVTERREAAAALRQRTDELEAVFRALPDLYFRMGADGTVLDYRAGRQFGLYVPPEAFLGRRVQDVLPDPVGPRVAGGLAEVAATRDAVHFEYTLPLGDEPRHYEARLLPLGDDQVVGVVRDVTERTRAAAALRASEASYRGLFDSLTDLVYVQDFEGRFLAVNEAVVRAYGYTREELIGQTPLLLTPPGTVEPGAMAEVFDRVVAGETVRTDWLAQRKDGSTFYKEIVIHRSTYFGEDVVLAVARDVTERVEAERALRFQKALLEAEGEASIDGILVVSREGEVLSTNGRFLEMWEIPVEETDAGAGAALLDVVLDRTADPDASRAQVEHLCGHPDETARDEVALRDGRVFDLHTAPVRSADGEAYGRVWFFRDVTAEKRHAEELDRARLDAERAREEADRTSRHLARSLDELRAAQDRLVQQEKMAGLGRLTAGIAHEIRNPLTFVSGFSEVTAELLKDAREAHAAGDSDTLVERLDDADANVARVIQHGQRAAAIVAGMLEHAKSTSADPAARRDVDVNRLVRELAEGAAGTGCRVVVDCGDDVGTVRGTGQDLTRVVRALLANAVEAVADHDGEAPPGEVRVRTWRGDGAVRIAVADDGPGVPEALLDRLFEPFVTSKSTGSGHPGLGLSLAHDTVALGYGGRIEVESGPGGATFTVVWPVDDRESRPLVHSRAPGATRDVAGS